MDKVTKGKEGSGLDAKIIEYVRDHMAKVASSKLNRRKSSKKNISTLIIHFNDYGKQLDIRHFRDIFMRVILPEGRPHTRSNAVSLTCGIDTLVAHTRMKKSKDKSYFDSFDDGRPLIEFVHCLGKRN